MPPKPRRTLVLAAAFIAVLCAVSIVPKLLLERQGARRGFWWRRMQALVNATGGAEGKLSNTLPLLSVRLPASGTQGEAPGSSEALGGGGGLRGAAGRLGSADQDGGVGAERAGGEGGSHVRAREHVNGSAGVAARSSRKRVEGFQFEVNPTIRRCNVPDAELLPNAWPNASRGGPPGGDGCAFWRTSRSKATFSLLMRGRMANGMLQYLWCRIKADANGWGMHPINEKTFAGMPWVSPVRHFQHAVFGKDPAAPLAKVNLAGCGPHFQKYSFFKDERCLAQCVFSRRPAANFSHKIFGELGPNDVVIHYREPVELINPILNVQRQAWNRTIPPFEYYDTILTRLRDRGELGKIWIALAFDFTGMPSEMMQGNVIPSQVLDKFGGEIIYGTSEQDHYVARQAPIFIGSFGTYSWTIAYLSAAREIHLPYDSAEKAGSSWNRWSHLFIHDDPRIFYHECFGEARFQSSSEVAQMDTKFGWALRRRSRDAGSCNPRLVDQNASFL